MSVHVVNIRKTPNAACQATTRRRTTATMSHSSARVCEMVREKRSGSANRATADGYAVRVPLTGIPTLVAGSAMWTGWKCTQVSMDLCNSFTVTLETFPLSSRNLLRARYLDITQVVPSGPKVDARKDSDLKSNRLPELPNLISPIPL